MSEPSSEEMRAARARGELFLPCSECRQWGDLRPGQCPHCGSALDLTAIRVASGLWKLNLVEALAFSLLALLLGSVCFSSGAPPYLKFPAGFASGILSALGLSQWRLVFFAAQRWWTRR